ncbi:hypothetical protein lbkm_3137 [Lachnospiraceae bacterium KM106-2]|nr:hypothetical protein lbkm_3137 [Lachnospiraceae bacterium KM106-2]
MIGYELGQIVKSLAGHDKEEIFVIIKVDGEYVYLVDGKVRTIEKPKYKKCKHIQSMEYIDAYLVSKMQQGVLMNSDVRNAIKKFIANYK